MVYRKLEHTKQRTTRMKRAYAWNFGSLACFVDKNTHQLTRLCIQRQGQRGALSLPFTLLLI